MSVGKIVQIVNKLINATDDGKVNWEETEIEDVFQVSYPSYSIRLFKTPSETDPGDIDYVISILNENGKILESATDVALKDLLPDSYLKMKALHESAKGYALGIEQTLDKIISDLPGEDIPF